MKHETSISRIELWIAFIGLLITILASVLSGGMWLGSMQSSIVGLQNQENQTFSLVQTLVTNTRGHASATNTSILSINK